VSTSLFIFLFIHPPPTELYTLSLHDALRSRDNGVDLHTGIKVEGFEGDTRVRRVQTSEGAFDADLVIVGVGIQPNVELAQDVGISVSNGIDVDELCRTSAPGVFAAGDVARHPNPYCNEPIRVEHWQ